MSLKLCYGFIRVISNLLLTTNFIRPVLDYTPYSMIPCAFSQVDMLMQSNLYSSNFSSIGDNLSTICRYQPNF